MGIFSRREAGTLVDVVYNNDGRTLRAYSVPGNSGGLGIEVTRRNGLTD